MARRADGIQVGGEELGPGQLIYLTAGETHALRGIEDASLLVTILSARG